MILEFRTFRNKIVFMKHSVQFVVLTIMFCYRYPDGTELVTQITSNTDGEQIIQEHLQHTASRKSSMFTPYILIEEIVKKDFLLI